MPESVLGAWDVSGAKETKICLYGSCILWAINIVNKLYVWRWNCYGQKRGEGQEYTVGRPQEIVPFVLRPEEGVGVTLVDFRGKNSPGWERSSCKSHSITGGCLACSKKSKETWWLERGQGSNKLRLQDGQCRCSHIGTCKDWLLLRVKLISELSPAVWYGLTYFLKE